jgi:hypothetical protein
MSSRTPRDEGHDRVVEIQGNNPVITQRLIGSNTESIHGMDDTMTLPKLQKNRAERRKTDPTSTDSLEIILGKVGVAFRMDDDCLHILTNNRPKMRRDLNQRNPTNRRNRPVKLEISTNNYTKSIRSPDETGTTIKSALIQFCEHVDAVPYKMKMKKYFNFPKWENGAGSVASNFPKWEKKHHQSLPYLFVFFLVISSFIILLTTQCDRR